MDKETLLTVGDWILVLGLIPLLVFVVDYGILRPLRGYRPWWKSVGGFALMLVGVGLASSDIVVLVHIHLGPEYVGREFVRIIGYAISTAGSFALVGMYLWSMGPPGLSKRSRTVTILKDEAEPEPEPSNH